MVDSGPAFLRKLWRIVQSSETDGIIHWSAEGNSFVVADAMGLVKVLPIWFKHGNVASFIRQLNMYGFRKIMTLDNGLTNVNTMEYAHPNFVKFHPTLVGSITRRTPVMRKQEESGPVSVMMSQLQEASSSQETLTSQLELMRTKHVQLVNELNALRTTVLKRTHADSEARPRLREVAKTAANHSTNFNSSLDDTGGVTNGSTDLGRLLVQETIARLELLDQRRNAMLHEHELRKRELELCLSTEKERAERETMEWSLRMKSRDQKLANLRLRNDILREELRSQHR